MAFWYWMGAALPLEVLAKVLYVLAIRDSPLALTLPYSSFEVSEHAGGGL